MNLDIFQALPDESPLWVYGFETALDREKKEILERKLTAFLPHWETHGSPVRGVFEIFEDRFLILSGHAPGGISGCAVDSSVRVFKQLREEGLDGLERSRVYFRAEDGSIQAIHFTAFQPAIDEGRVVASTPVFDTNLGSLGQLRQAGFEKPFGESWHARAFSLPESI